jgi:hypothetical protein
MGHRGGEIVRGRCFQEMSIDPAAAHARPLDKCIGRLALVTSACLSLVLRVRDRLGRL